MGSMRADLAHVAVQGKRVSIQRIAFVWNDGPGKHYLVKIGATVVAECNNPTTWLAENEAAPSSMRVQLRDSDGRWVDLVEYLRDKSMMETGLCGRFRIAPDA